MSGLRKLFEKEYWNCFSSSWEKRTSMLAVLHAISEHLLSFKYFIVIQCYYKNLYTLHLISIIDLSCYISIFISVYYIFFRIPFHDPIGIHLMALRTFYRGLLIHQKRRKKKTVGFTVWFFFSLNRYVEYAHLYVAQYFINL